MNASSGINKDSDKGTGFLSPKRITVTVSAMTAQKLRKRGLAEGRSLSNLAAFLLEQSLEVDSRDRKQCSAVVGTEDEIITPTGFQASLPV